jgi:cytochrome c553
LPTSSDDVEARRQAVLIGCYAGCHGPTGQGLTMVEAGIHRITAPSLTEVLPTYTDGELVRLLRYGVRRDGTTALMMPADTFFPMSDAHIGQIVDFLRRQPVMKGPPRERHLTLKARLGILLGEYPLSVAMVDPSAARLGDLPRTTAVERGRYIASTICAECHGRDFSGDPIDGGPSLNIAAAYDAAAFTRLLRTGVPLGGPRDIGIMGRVARDAFSQFRDDEIADLYVFLRQRAGVPEK